MKKPTKTYTGKYYRHKELYILLKVVGEVTFEWRNFESSSDSSAILPIEGLIGYELGNTKTIKLSDLITLYTQIGTVFTRRDLPDSKSLPETFILILDEDRIVTNLQYSTSPGRGWWPLSVAKRKEQGLRPRKKPKGKPKLTNYEEEEDEEFEEDEPVRRKPKRSPKRAVKNMIEDSWEARVALIVEDID